MKLEEILSDPHRLVKRQFNRAFPDGECNMEGLAEFVRLVNASYEYTDEERTLNQRADRISQQELEALNNELISKNEFLDSFNYGLAHDVKNHTANIQGLIRMLEKYDRMKNREMVAFIVEKLDVSLNQMSSILNGFLYLANVESNIREHFSLIQPKSIENEVVLELAHLIEGHEEKLNLEVNLPDTYYSHHIIRIILVNLISNAIKFSKSKKKMQVDARAWRSNEEITIEVKDTGIGMNMSAEGAKVLSLFGRSNKSGSTKGYGIGLYIIKKIMDRQNGKIDLKSEPNMGTCVTINLPYNGLENEV